MKPQRITPIDTRKRENARTACTVKGCAKPVLAKGLCGLHYRSAEEIKRAALRAREAMNE